MYYIKNDIDFEAVLILTGMIYYPYATPEARTRYDSMTEDEKVFYQKHLTITFESDIMREEGEENHE